MVWIIVMCLSDAHSDGTHSLPLLRHWCRDTWWRNKHIFSKSSFVNKLLLIWICKCEWTVESSRCVCEGTAGLLSVFPLSLTLTGLSDVICPAASEAEQIWCENNTRSFMSSGNCSSFNINQWLSAGFASGHWTLSGDQYSLSYKSNLGFLKSAFMHDYMCLWSTKAVISNTGIFVAIDNNTLYGSKLLIFL